MDTDKQMAKKNMEDFGIEKQWRQKFSEADLYKEFTSDENGENQLSPKEGEAKIHKLGGYEKVYRIKFESDYLAKLVYEGAERLYGKPLSQEVDERIRFELHTIKTLHYEKTSPFGAVLRPLYDCSRTKHANFVSCRQPDSQNRRHFGTVAIFCFHG